MKIAVLAASGKQGKLLVKEAQTRNLDVAAFVRSESKQLTGVKNVIKDIFDITYEDIAEYDVIINAFGVWTPDTVEQYQTSLKHLIDILKGKPNRLLVVGGAGSLFTDATHTLKVIDTPDFPDDWKPIAGNAALAYKELQKHDDINWTYVSPSAMFDAEGERTGKYKTGGDELLVNAKGESYISYADYAVAMIDEAINAKHIKQRITFVSE